MNDPLRLIHGGGGSLDRLLLTEAGAEVPSAELEALMLAPLGLAATPAFPRRVETQAPPAATGPGALAQGSLPAGAAPALLNSAPLLKWAAPLKWAALGALAVGVTVAGVSLRSGTTDTAAPPQMSTAATESPAAVTPGPAAVTPGSAAATPGSAELNVVVGQQTQARGTITGEAASNARADAPHSGLSDSVHSTPRAELAPKATGVEQSAERVAEPDTEPTALRPMEASDQQINDRPAPLLAEQHQTSPSQPVSSTLKEELKLLDRARTALKSGQAEQSLTWLNRYATQFPTGILGEEAAVLRTDARKLQAKDTQNPAR